MFCSYEFALSNSVIVLFVSIVFSMEINRRRYFRSGPHINWDSRVIKMLLLRLADLERSVGTGRANSVYQVLIRSI